MKKASLLVIAAILIGGDLLIADADSPLNYRMKQRNQAQTGGKESGCAALPAQEKQFAMKLSPMHRSLFCDQFTVEQRAEAMALVNIHKGQKGRKGMTPDEAVEEVMKTQRGAGKRKQSDQRYYGAHPTNTPQSNREQNADIY